MAIGCTQDESSKQVKGFDDIENTELMVHNNAEDLASDEIRNLLHRTWTIQGHHFVYAGFAWQIDYRTT